MAWGGGSCQGIIAGHNFAIEAGLQKITEKLTKAIDRKIALKLSLRSRSSTDEGGHDDDADDEEAVKLTVAELTQICDKVKRELITNFGHDSPLCAQLEKKK